MNYETYEVKVYKNGDRFWYQNDNLHRLDGPAIEWADGDKYWYQNGKWHRLDGPAVESADGTKWYCIEGIKYSYHNWKREVAKKTKVNQPYRKSGIPTMIIGIVMILLCFGLNIWISYMSNGINVSDWKHDLWTNIQLVNYLFNLVGGILLLGIGITTWTYYKEIE